MGRTPPPQRSSETATGSGCACAPHSLTASAKPSVCSTVSRTTPPRWSRFMPRRRIHPHQRRALRRRDRRRRALRRAHRHPAHRHPAPRPARRRPARRAHRHLAPRPAHRHLALRPALRRPALRRTSPRSRSSSTRRLLWRRARARWSPWSSRFSYPGWARASRSARL